MRYRLLVLAASLIAAAAGLPATAHAAAWHATTGLTPGGHFPGFVGVGAASATDVWAVGENDADLETPYAEHWNGFSWSEVSVVRPGTDNSDSGMFGVSALSASNAWAVGWTDYPTYFVPLIEHWNGSAWTIIPSASTPAQSLLNDVAATSSSNVWAVGELQSGPLAEHWNGKAWTVVATPGAQALLSVKAVTASNVWAVGKDEIEHYNGTKWGVVKFPGAASNPIFNQVNRVPGTTHMWAVGYNDAHDPVALYYNGSKWTDTHLPGPGLLFGVAADSATNAWAAGYQASSGTPYVIHWNGSKWSVVTGTALNDGQVSHMTRAPNSSELWAVGSVATPVDQGETWAAYYR